MGTYRVFTANWWKYNKDWPDGLEPDPTARKHTIAKGVESEEEAQRICREWNATHKPGKLSRKAEYEDEKPKRKRR